MTFARHSMLAAAAVAIASMFPTPARADDASKGAKKVLSTAMQLGVERVPFPVEIHEVRAGDTVGGEGGSGKRDGYDVFAFPTDRKSVV